MQVSTLLNQTPYLSDSHHLIDCIFIYGYYPEQYEYLIEHYKTYNNQEPQEIKHKLLNTIKPTILSSIYSPYSTSQVQYDATLNVFTPSFLPPIPITSSSKPPEPSNIVFFRNFYNDETKTNIVRYGFGYIFYETYNAHYIPKIIGFITKYPCYNLLANISKNIVMYITKQSITLPLEFILYNIVNFIPPPIHSAIKLDINSKEHDLTLLSSNYIMNQVSGYPYFDFKLMEIFKVIPLELLIKIVVFSFLEETILIFSQNLEHLNIVLFIISNLSYPLVDTNYLWHIVSCSLSDLKGETFNNILNQSSTKLTGINCAYSEVNNDMSLTINESFFVVDLEQRTMKYNPSDTSSVVLQLYEYINTILEDKSTNLTHENVILEKAIKILNFSLGLLWRTYSSKPDVGALDKPMFFSETFTEETNLENKELLNVFYKFILSISLSTYSKLLCEYSTEHKLTFRSNEIDDTNIKEEGYFFTKMKENSKYELFFKNYIQDKKIYNSLRVPYIFAEEFMNYKKINKDVCFESKLLDIIDYFYFNCKDSEDNISDTNITNISFKKLYSSYNDNPLIKYVFLDDTSSYTIDTLPNAKYTFNYNNFDIDLRVVFNYAHTISNVNESDLLDIIPSLRVIQQSPVKQIEAIYVCNVIEKFSIENELLDSQHLISFSMFNTILSLGTIDTVYHNIYSVIQVLASLKFNIRKYLTLFLEKCNNNFTTTSNAAIPLGVCNELIKLLTIGHIMPNEHLVYLFESFVMKNIKLNNNESLLGKGIDQADKVYSIEVNEHFDQIYSKNEKLVFIYGDVNFFDMFFEEVDEEIKEKFITLKFNKSGKKEIIGLMSPKELYDKCNEIYDGYVNGKVVKKEMKKSKKEFIKIMGNMIFFCEYLWDKDYFNFNYLVEYVMALKD